MLVKPSRRDAVNLMCTNHDNVISEFRLGLADLGTASSAHFKSISNLLKLRIQAALRFPSQ